ncbi:hemolytic protein [Erysipelothrix rhusiopathiae]|uniref:hemolytic protein n=1 Tax=Erysipelothrix rhusiopathiae TaxID=1648 RepID=UPI000DFFD442|nr:hemolytic protein [Erysipelothrix rhusiopathiae]MCG4436946.1 hemolytic protein [Erysipelothrix rhusiopathiae]MCG4457322.1 hemolytic protein [Erysipelothrix rhusiopathiae]MDE8033504.1 hemolytic protein [Erysipelothrix rhusiopathiae]MDE8052258.1 hemolytic protein [Erysipelothrix rhusiopathiae]MDE8053147.1 hemolytic protein [Erysipelothrix rhusiopathiae]
MKKIIVAVLFSLVLVGCSANKNVCTVEADGIKRTLKLDVKNSEVVGLAEETVIQMDKATQMNTYDDLYKQFAESKVTDGVTFEYEKSDTALTVKTTVDLAVAKGTQLEKYFSYLNKSGQKIILDQEDLSVDAVKAALESEGSFSCSGK